MRCARNGQRLFRQLDPVSLHPLFLSPCTYVWSLPPGPTWWGMAIRLLPVALHTAGTQLAAQGGSLKLSPPPSTRPASFNLRHTIQVLPPGHYRRDRDPRLKALWIRCALLLCPALSDRLAYTVVETTWGTGYWHHLEHTRATKAVVEADAVDDGDARHWSEERTCLW